MKHSLIEGGKSSVLRIIPSSKTYHLLFKQMRLKSQKILSRCSIHTPTKTSSYGHPHPVLTSQTDSTDQKQKRRGRANSTFRTCRSCGQRVKSSITTNRNIGPLKTWLAPSSFSVPAWVNPDSLVHHMSYGGTSRVSRLRRIKARRRRKTFGRRTRSELTKRRSYRMAYLKRCFKPSNPKHP